MTEKTEVVLQEKHEMTISKNPVILAGCPVFLNSLQETLEKKMNSYFIRNMVVFGSDYKKERTDYSNKKVIYLISEVAHCRQCFLNGYSANDVNESLIIELDKIDDLCIDIMLFVSKNHPFVRR